MKIYVAFREARGNIVNPKIRYEFPIKGAFKIFLEGDKIYTAHTDGLRIWSLEGELLKHISVRDTRDADVREGKIAIASIYEGIKLIGFEESSIDENARLISIGSGFIAYYTPKKELKRYDGESSRLIYRGSIDSLAAADEIAYAVGDSVYIDGNRYDLSAGGAKLATDGDRFFAGDEYGYVYILGSEKYKDHEAPIRCLSGSKDLIASVGNDIAIRLGGEVYRLRGKPKDIAIEGNLMATLSGGVFKDRVIVYELFSPVEKPILLKLEAKRSVKDHKLLGELIDHYKEKPIEVLKKAEEEGILIDLIASLVDLGLLEAFSEREFISKIPAEKIIER